MFGKAAIQLLAALILLAGAVFGFRTWLESHDDQLQLKATLAAQKQLISAADAREQSRTAELNSALAQIAAEKRAAQSPEQIANALSRIIPLPQPIELTSVSEQPGKQGTAGQKSEKGSALPKIPPSAGATQAGNQQELPDSPSSLSAGPSVTQKFSAQLPAADLKPLYDYAQDCKACQLKLNAANADLADERNKSSAIAKERDSAIRAAKGGSLWTRLKRNARWFAVGAGFGAAATLAARR